MELSEVNENDHNLNAENTEDVSWILLSDIPTGTLIGFDTNVWTVGPNFRGIRDIPLGLHYLYFNAGSSNGDSSISGLRCSHFLHITEACVIKKRWNAEAEIFTDLPSSSEDVERMRSNSTEVAAYLAAYPRDKFAQWVALASRITPESVSQLEPSGRWIFSCPQVQPQAGSTSLDRAALTIPPRLLRGTATDADGVTPMETEPASIGEGEKKLLAFENVIPETELHWTQLPPHPLFPPDSTAAEISKHNMDQSYTLERVLEQLGGSGGVGDETVAVGTTTALAPGEARLLSELHLSFVVFLLGQVLEAWYQWRRIFSLLANCERAVVERPRLYKALISSLYRLLVFSDRDERKKKGRKNAKSSDGECGIVEDLFGAWETNGEPAFLPRTIMRLLGNIEIAVGTAKIQHQGLLREVEERAKGLRDCLERRFKVNLDIGSGKRAEYEAAGEIPFEEVDWDTDEAPVIVTDI